MRPKMLAALGAVVVAFGAAPALALAHHGGTGCRDVHVPAPVPGADSAQLYGQLCLPPGPPPDTVQFLVHGASYTHAFWDWPVQPWRYSYVRRALGRGYATFAVDRLGNGQSTRPDSTVVTFQNDALALHEAIDALRAGHLGVRPFGKVVWVGHSMGALAGWLEASTFHDVDAFVLADMLHFGKPSFFAKVAQDSYAASEDPKFASLGLDPGWVTSKPGTRGDLYYWVQNTDPAVLAEDERSKDVLSATERSQARQFTGEEPVAATTHAIAVSTLLLVGDNDNLFCGPPDGLDCSVAGVTAHEAPYYSPAAHLAVDVVPNTGHDFQLHRSAPQADDEILDWIDAIARPRPWPRRPG